MANPKILISKILILLLFFISGCTDYEKSASENIYLMHKLSDNDWIKLSETKVFFGHRSVGSNIIDGIIELKSESRSSEFIILETKDKLDFTCPVFGHARIGENLYPIKKIDEFVKILESGIGDSIDIAFMKLCFGDINRQTDIKGLFEYYKRSINSVQTKFPHLKIIHFTVPLTVKRTGIKGVIRRILLMDDNPYRHKFNELIRTNYKSVQIFDLARIEATFPDKKLNYYGMRKTPGLIPEYASDGSHLNQYGKMVIGSELLSFLSGIIDK